MTVISKQIVNRFINEVVVKAFEFAHRCTEPEKQLS